VETLLLIFLMALVTYLPRALPVIALERLTERELVKKWLSSLPSAILSSLLISSLLIKDSHLFIEGNLQLIAIVPTILVALKTRSLILTVLAGVSCYFLILRLVPLC